MREYSPPFNDLVIGNTYRVEHYHLNNLIKQDMGRVNNIGERRITFERVGYDRTLGAAHLRIGQKYDVPRRTNPAKNYHWKVFESGQDGYARRILPEVFNSIGLNEKTTNAIGKGWFGGGRKYKSKKTKKTKKTKNKRKQTKKRNVKTIKKNKKR